MALFSVWVCLIMLVVGFFLAYLEAKRSYAPIYDIAKQLRIYQNKGNVNEFFSIKSALDDLQLENTQFRDRIAEYFPIMKNNLLCYMLKEADNKNISSEDMLACKIEFPHNNFLVAILQIEVIDVGEENDKFNSITMNAFLKYYIENFMNTTDVTCYLAEKQDGSIIMILNSAHNEMAYFDDRITKLFSGLRKQIDSSTEIIVLAGFSEIQTSASALATAYSQAKSAIRYQYMKIGSDFIWYADIKENTFVQYQFTFEQEQKIMNLMKAGDAQKTEEYVNVLLDQYFSQGRMKREDGLYIFNEILSTCIKVMHEVKGLHNHSISFNKLVACTKFNEMNEYVFRSINEVCMAVSQNKGQCTDKLSNSIIELLESSYCNNDITLTYLSEEFHVSSSYISRLIKDNLGINFVEYLNKCRITKAKELLKDDSILVKDIAVLVGYDCDKNFRRVFKKYEGITPGEYRNQRN